MDQPEPHRTTEPPQQRDPVNRLALTPAAGHGQEVLYATDGPLGRIVLNRPRAINSLTHAMCLSLLDQLRRWADDDTVRAVVVQGAGERGLCAGGDVRALREAVLAGRPEEAEEFWRVEYRLNQLIADYPKPYLAWMDGVVMGGGLGISAHASHRLVTDRTVAAMPETVIGFFPDVGMLHLLGRAPDELGTHAALTGTTVTGADAVLLGLADALAPVPDLEAVLARVRPVLADGGPMPEAAQLGAETAAEAPWQRHRAWTAGCYAGDDAATVLDRLERHPDGPAREAAEMVRQRSPHSVVLTLAALRRVQQLDLDLPEVLAQDLRAAASCGRHPDFVEGVRAQLVDKDKQPRWAQPDLGSVDRAQVAAALAG